jgi:hypothetical protein
MLPDYSSSSPGSRGEADRYVLIFEPHAPVDHPTMLRYELAQQRGHDAPVLDEEMRQAWGRIQ